MKFGRYDKWVQQTTDYADSWYSSYINSITSAASMPPTSDYWVTSGSNAVKSSATSAADSLNQDVTLNAGTIYELEIQSATISGGILKIIGVGAANADVNITYDSISGTAYAQWTQGQAMTKLEIYADGSTDATLDDIILRDISTGVASTSTGIICNWYFYGNVYTTIYSQPLIYWD